MAKGKKVKMGKNDTPTQGLSYQQLDFRSLSITLLGSNNNTMTGTVNLSAMTGPILATPEEEAYDDSGAAYYVCAVILVYGLSIVSLIGSLAKKKMKDNKCEQEEVQITRYLHKAQDLREKSARDNYRQLKRNVIKLVEEKKTPTPTPESSLSDPKFRFPEPDGAQGALDTRQQTPHHQAKHKGKGKNSQLEGQHLLAPPEDEERGSRLPPPPPPHGTAMQAMSESPELAKTLPFERLKPLDSPQPEEKITVVQSIPTSKSDPVGIAPKDSESNILLKNASGQGRPKYRWSLGADGNIWIMQVDEKGEERLAAPPKVDSLPPPPSPEYEPPRFSHRHQGDQGQGVPRPTAFTFEDERPYRPGAARVYTQGQYPAVPSRHGSQSSGSSGSRQPARVPPAQATSYSLPSRSSLTPPRDTQHRPNHTKQPRPSPSQYQPVARESSRSPSPGNLGPYSQVHAPSSIPRGPSLSPPAQRHYGTRHASKSRDRSHSPKSGSHHSSPQRSRSGRKSSPGDEELMQVTCV